MPRGVARGRQTSSPSHRESQPEHPAGHAEAALLTPVTDAPPTPDVDHLAAMFEGVMSDVALLAPAQRLLRLYASDLQYALAHPTPGSIGRKIISKLPLCLVTLQGMSMKTLSSPSACD